MVKDVNGSLMIILFRLKLDRFYSMRIIASLTEKKAKYRYSKEKVTWYYLRNKEAIKEKSKSRYKILSKEEKTRLKSIKEKDPV